MEEFYREVMHLHDETLISQLCAFSRFVELKKNNILIDVGEVPSRLCLLKSGGLRGYYLDEHKHEVTDCFCSAPGDALMPGFDLEKPSALTITAYKDSQIVCLPLAECLAAISASEEGRACYAGLVQTAAMRHHLIKSQLYRPATERYEWFLRTYPTEAAEVSGRCIASFLGITPITLSRLRRKQRDEAHIYPPPI